MLATGQVLTFATVSFQAGHFQRDSLD